MAEIKYYAAQVAPEYQDSNFDRCNWWGWTVTGNRDYEGFTTAEYNKLFGTNGNVGALDLMVEEYQIMVENVNNSEYNTLEELLQGELGDYNRDWTPEQLEQWKEILSQDVPRWENMKCKALSLLCNREYAYKAIHGVCQSDWQRCYYPKDEENLLGDLEMQYFNTGEEWEVCDAAEIEEQGLPAPANGNEVCDLMEVSTSYYIDGSYSRENLAKALGCKPDEIKMWRWKGYRKISEYEEDR